MFAWMIIIPRHSFVNGDIKCDGMVPFTLNRSRLLRSALQNDLSSLIKITILKPLNESFFINSFQM